MTAGSDPEHGGSGDSADVGDVADGDEQIIAAVVVQPDGACPPPGAGDELAVEPTAVLEAHADVVALELS
jgi:hypothetical protein